MCLNFEDCNAAAIMVKRLYEVESYCFLFHDVRWHNNSCPQRDLQGKCNAKVMLMRKFFKHIYHLQFNNLNLPTYLYMCVAQH